MDVLIIPFAYFTPLIVFNSFDIFLTHSFMFIHMRHTLWTGISETNVNVITSATRTHAFNNNNNITKYPANHTNTNICIHTTKLFQRLFSGVSVTVDGYMGSVNPVGGFQQLDVAVCTIEKANGLVNRLVREDSISQLGRTETLAS